MRWQKTVAVIGIGLLLCRSACSSTADSASSSTTTPSPDTMNTQNPITRVDALAKWYPLLGEKEAVLRERLQPTQILENTAYEGWKGLTRMHSPGVDPAFYYLKGEKVALIVMEDPALMSRLDEASLFKALGPAAAAQQLASCADKQATHYAYAEDGIAFSIWDGQAVFVELFQPMSLDTYKEKIYLKPGPRPL